MDPHNDVEARVAAALRHLAGGRMSACSTMTTGERGDLIFTAHHEALEYLSTKRKNHRTDPDALGVSAGSA